MKKVLGIGSCIVGLLLVVFGSIMKMKENTDVSIIGGVDGPTSVFVAGKLNSDLAIILILIGIVLLVIAVIAYLKRKH
ncbi:MAG: oxaloacetate decarboxylase [[Clostridium] nexile]